MKYLLIFADGKNSLPAIYLHAAAEMKILPAAIMQVAFLSPHRIRELTRTWGRANLAKRILSFITPALDAGSEDCYLEKWSAEQGFAKERNVAKICKRLSLRRFSVVSLNTPSAVNLLSRERFDFAVYLSGGILREKFLACFKHGVLNAHAGVLPQIRGMNAIEWSVIQGLPPTVTVHKIVDEGIDTGPMLIHEILPIEKSDTILTVRGKSRVLSVTMLLRAVQLQLAGSASYTDQRPEEGKQYFVMDQLLLPIAELRLKRLSQIRLCE